MTSKPIGGSKSWSIHLESRAYDYRSTIQTADLSQNGVEGFITVRYIVVYNTVSYNITNHIEN